MTEIILARIPNAQLVIGTGEGARAFPNRLMVAPCHPELERDARRIDALVHAHVIEVRAAKQLEFPGEIDVGDLDL